MKGRFITLEGPEGGGKTSQTRLLFEQLRNEGFDVLLVREPGGTPIGDQIRAVLHDHTNVGMLPNTELLLFSASRGQLVGEVIRPALERGAIVLCDRYADSTYAYQGYGLGLNVNALRVITAFATGGLLPDLTFCLDLPVEEGLRRKRMAYESGASEWNRIDARDLAFHKRVHAGYHELVKRDPARWVVVDATQPFEKVAGDIRQHVDQLLASMKG
ncbi:MAG: dTMP kinase [Chloroflexi bacterium]|nr:dTMP kinase [Chloroflexota bacterium]